MSGAPERHKSGNKLRTSSCFRKRRCPGQREIKESRTIRHALRPAGSLLPGRLSAPEVLRRARRRTHTPLPGLSGCRPLRAAARGPTSRRLRLPIVRHLLGPPPPLLRGRGCQGCCLRLVVASSLLLAASSFLVLAFALAAVLPFDAALPFAPPGGLLRVPPSSPLLWLGRPSRRAPAALSAVAAPRCSSRSAPAAAAPPARVNFVPTAQLRPRAPLAQRRPPVVSGPRP